MFGRAEGVVEPELPVSPRDQEPRDPGLSPEMQAAQAFVLQEAVLSRLVDRYLPPGVSHRHVEVGRPGDAGHPGGPCLLVRVAFLTDLRQARAGRDSRIKAGIIQARKEGETEILREHKFTRAELGHGSYNTTQARAAYEQLDERLAREERERLATEPEWHCDGFLPQNFAIPTWRDHAGGATITGQELRLALAPCLKPERLSRTLALLAKGSLGVTHRVLLLGYQPDRAQHEQIAAAHLDDARVLGPDFTAWIAARTPAPAELPAL